VSKPSAARLGAQGKVDLPGEVFGEPFHQAVVYEAVRSEQLARRRGTAATRTRGQVSGGGAKPWRQKGTGRARAGTIRPPHWTGGGVAFGPTPRSYTVKVNRKARRRALRSALSEHARRGTIAIVDAAKFEQPSTRQAVELLGDFRPAKGALLVLLADEEETCGMSFRNLDRAAVLPASEAGVADVIGAAAVVVSEAAVGVLGGIGREPAANRKVDEGGDDSRPREDR
jgi:large subunit ribosomal protein L4